MQKGGEKSSADKLIRASQDVKGCKRQIQRCITDMNVAIRALTAGAMTWKEDASNQTLKQYIVCNDAALKMNDKFDFLRQLLTQFNGLRTEEEVDGAYEKEIEECVTGKEPEVTRATTEWDEISANFVEKMN